MKINTVIKGLLLSAAAIIIGFAAIAFPFKLFDNLSREGMQLLFISEIVIYFALAMIFIAVNEMKKKKAKLQKEKELQRRFQRRAKFEQAQREYYDLAA